MKKHLTLTLTLIALLLLISNPAITQTVHDCDKPDVGGATFAVGTTVKAQFCQALDRQIDAVTVYDGAVPTQITTLNLVNSTPNAEGLVLYEVVLGTFAKGGHTLTISNWNKSVEGAVQEGPRSAPFSLSVVDQKAAPVVPRWKRVAP